MLKGLFNKTKKAINDINNIKDDISDFIKEEDKAQFLKDKVKDAIVEKKNEIQEKRHYEKHKYEILSSGNLPYITPSSIILKPDEECHYESVANRVVISAKTSYRTRSVGVSFRVTKGVSVGSRQGYVEPIKSKKSEEFEGRLYITSKRIIFLNREKGAEFDFDKITAVEHYKDGLEFFVGSRSYLFKIPDVREFAATMQGVGKKYYDNK